MLRIIIVFDYIDGKSDMFLDFVNISMAIFNLCYILKKDMNYDPVSNRGLDKGPFDIFVKAISYTFMMDPDFIMFCLLAYHQFILLELSFSMDVF